ncbi:MAG: FAD-dependent oxidoreductase [Chloroflexi bacterium]|nr:FAD-dependent oxidoreductase [Chloroflexota bacterium]
MSEFESLLYPYPIDYEEVNEVSADVVVLGGGIAGCWAAIAAAKKGLKVVLVEKGATIRSGCNGPGVDHWANALTNPACPISPEEFVEATLECADGWFNGLTQYISCRDSYECLLEVEQMGVKVRDTEDEFKGADFRDEKTKLLYAHDEENKYVILLWGTGVKPALYNECTRLGVRIFDRIAASSLLTEGGQQGARVIGATGVHVRTGAFYVFKAKAVVMGLSVPKRVWTFSQELGGLFAHLGPNTSVGSGHAMAWKAGAAFNTMERSGKVSGGFSAFVDCSARTEGAWEPCGLVDSRGKEVPWIDRDGNVLDSIEARNKLAPGQKFNLSYPGTGWKHYYPWVPKYEFRRNTIIRDLGERANKGEFVPPFYGDTPGLPETYRRKIWGFMIGQEGTTRIMIYKHYLESGFDPEKDMVQYYGHYAGSGGYTGSPSGPEAWRELRAGPAAGGLLVDWDMRTTLEGLYAAGECVWATGGHSIAATTGRWAGRHAADYARQASEPVVSSDQVQQERARVYAPVRRERSIAKGAVDWKEFNLGISRTMQLYCPKTKNDEMLKIGLIQLQEFRESEGQRVFAREPHELMRALEAYDILEVGEIILNASLARKASCDSLEFYRLDYPEDDPPEWHKFLTVSQDNGKPKVGELSMNFWGSLEDNYESHYSPEE